jgi:uncharacterized protein YcfJ
MKLILSCVVLALSIGTISADAKGCLKGAVVGGVVGHFAGRHAAAGAAAGCVIGHHEANKNQDGSKNQRNE